MVSSRLHQEVCQLAIALGQPMSGQCPSGCDWREERGQIGHTYRVLISQAQAVECALLVGHLGRIGMFGRRYDIEGVAIEDGPTR